MRRSRSAIKSLAASNMEYDKKNEGQDRYRAHTVKNEKTVATLLSGLCKSCGECVVKCPVDAIDWDPDTLGQLGEPAIKIDMEKCIGCEICEQICPDFAIEITNLPKPPAEKAE
jgi:2-oxoglutarate ferredoxin oxidoreductase subunit delta